MQLLSDINNLTAYVNVHTFGQLVMGSWAYTNWTRPPNYQEMVRL
jgi:hypothetical protein